LRCCDLVSIFTLSDHTSVSSILGHHTIGSPSPPSTLWMSAWVWRISSSAVFSYQTAVSERRPEGGPG
jgi:hypothetical protein